MDVDLPAEDDPAAARGAALVRGAPGADAARAGRRGVRRAALAAAVGPRRRPELQLIIDDEMRRAGVSKPIEPDRHRPLRADPRRARRTTSRRTATSADAHGRGDVVPAVQRAGRGLRPRQPQHPRRARRRRLRRERPEDLDVARRASPSSAS